MMNQSPLSGPANTRSSEPPGRKPNPESPLSLHLIAKEHWARLVTSGAHSDVLHAANGPLDSTTP